MKPLEAITPDDGDAYHAAELKLSVERKPRRSSAGSLTLAGGQLPGVRASYHSAPRPTASAILDPEAHLCRV